MSAAPKLAVRENEASGLDYTITLRVPVCLDLSATVKYGPRAWVVDADTLNAFVRPPESTQSLEAWAQALLHALVASLAPAWVSLELLREAQVTEQLRFFVDLEEDDGSDPEE